jgi:hypothetical protein
MTEALLAGLPAMLMSAPMPPSRSITRRPENWT